MPRGCRSRSLTANLSAPRCSSPGAATERIWPPARTRPASSIARLTCCSGTPSAGPRKRGVASWDLWGIADARGRANYCVASAQEHASSELPRLEAAAQRDPVDGVYRFKKGWGGQVVRTMPAYDRVFIGHRCTGFGSGAGREA